MIFRSIGLLAGLVVFSTLNMGCSDSEAQSGTASLESLTERVEALEALAPIDISDGTALVGEWNLREYLVGSSTENSVGTITISDVDSFSITDCGPCAFMTFSCLDGSFSTLTATPSFDFQGVVRLSCSGEANNMFLLNSRRNNIRLLHPEKMTMIVLARDTETTSSGIVKP